MTQGGLSKQILLAALGAVFLPAALAAVERLSFRPGFNLFNPKQDVEIGQKSAAEADRQLPLVKDEQVLAYVNKLGKSLTQYEPVEANYPWTFKVVNSRDINAFALPGGFIYVNRGAIESAEDEAQLAGVIAHETGHVVMRHGTHQASQMMLAQLPLAILGGMLGQSGGLAEELARVGISFGLNATFLHYSRGMESQADQVGTYVLYHAGYDPYAMAQFFQIIEKKYPQQTVQFFSDHPVPENRIQAVDEEIPQLGPPIQGKKDSPEFEEIKKRLLAMPPPPKQPGAPAAPAPQGGGAPSPGDVMPGANYKAFNHNEFKITYPDNWQVYGDATSAVTIAPPAGITSNAVAYGVMIGTYQPEAATTALDTATHELIETLRQANPELRVVGHDESLRVNGAAARSVHLMGTSPVRGADGKPLSEHDWLVAVGRRDGSLVYLIFVAPERDVSNLSPAFNRMLKSFELR